MNVRCMLLPLIFCFATGQAAMGAVIVAGEQAFYSAPGSQSIEFFLDLTGPDDGGSLQVLNFQVRVQLTGSNAGTAAFVVGAGNTTNRTQAEPLVDTDFDPDEASGATFNLGPAFTIQDGEGLLRVDLEFTAAASGVYQLNILTGVNDTQLIGPDEEPIAFGTQDATIAPVPEPGTILLSMLAVASFGGCARLGRRRSKSS